MGKRRFNSDENVIIEEANYIISQKTTIRETAKCFGVSKSTVFIDLTINLETIDHELAKLVRERLNINKALRHIRGGRATKLKHLARRLNSK